ncbi:MAG: hypothetical protein GWN58_61930, partial [Anaerolineae bacterium]|nr:hypothetical protein [Anaerolineae bacterium]
MCALVLFLVLICLAACGAGQETGTAATGDPVATAVAVQKAVAATLTAEASIPGADMVSTQVAVARAAAATLTAEAPRRTLT